MIGARETGSASRRLWDDNEGLTSVEYALLLALIVVAGVVAFRNLGQTVATTVANSADTISSN